MDKNEFWRRASSCFQFDPPIRTRIIREEEEDVTCEYDARRSRERVFKIFLGF